MIRSFELTTVLLQPTFPKTIATKQLSDWFYKQERSFIKRQKSINFNAFA
jgi:hypothetical protein